MFRRSSHPIGICYTRSSSSNGPIDGELEGETTGEMYSSGEPKLGADLDQLGHGVHVSRSAVLDRSYGEPGVAHSRGIVDV